MTKPRYHFVTGRLAAESLRAVLGEIASPMGFEFTIDVLPITVAALMTPEWIGRHWDVPVGTTRVILPGYCGGELEHLASQAAVSVECGPKDLRRLPEFFGRPATSVKLDKFDIEIIAEINHAPRWQPRSLLTRARELQMSGADMIDVGCDPGTSWAGVYDGVLALRDAGLRVSIDSMRVDEITAAVDAGAELVLSVNSQNRAGAKDWGVEVVAVPDNPATLEGLDGTVEYLEQHGVSYRLDPILDPIGFGFAESLQRFFELRRRYPQSEMMMGIGNLTELTECDSAGINFILLAICQELGIRSVLTTEVINWARTSVLECDLARRLVHYAVTEKALPKHVHSGLVMLRDNTLVSTGRKAMTAMAEQVRDRNYRLFAEAAQVHAVTSGEYECASDPFLLFEQLQANRPGSIDAAHAFYLGYEMCKAVTALTLGKQYTQDEALDWGQLTVPEDSHRLRRSTDSRDPASGEPTS